MHKIKNNIYRQRKNAKEQTECFIMRIMLNRNWGLSAFLLAVVAMMLASCKTAQQVPYFQDPTRADSTITGLYDLRLKPKDELSIDVAMPDGSRTPFELIVQTRMMGNEIDYTKSVTRPATRPFLVENDGTINFPILGKIRVQGLTTEQVEAMLLEKMRSYLSGNAGTEPIVTVELLTYKVSVLGEVVSPGVYTFGQEKVNLLQALARAGDLTIHGKRKNVTLIRERADGSKEFHEFNLNDRNMVTSPYFYLEQDDIIYVEPNGVQKQNAVVSTTTRYWLRAIAITLSVATLLNKVL